MPVQVVSGGIFQEKNKLPDAVGDAPDSAKTATNTFVRDAVGAKQRETSLASQEMELIQYASHHPVG